MAHGHRGERLKAVVESRESGGAESWGPVDFDPALWTCESPAPGVRCGPPRRGYRWGVEVYALAAFALGGGPTPRSAADLGAGSGIVGLLLAYAGLRVEAWERAAAWHPALARSIAESGAPIRVHADDVRSVEGPRRFDVVVTNPPWFPADQPRSPDPWRAECRSMIHGDTRAFVDAGLRLAPRVCLVTRPARRPDLVGYQVVRQSQLGDQVLLVEVGEGAASPAWPAPEALDLVTAYARFGQVSAASGPARTDGAS